MASNLRDEMADHRQKQIDERDRLEIERNEEQWLEMERAVYEQNEKDMKEMGTMLESCGIGDGGEWDFVRSKVTVERGG